MRTQASNNIFAGLIALIALSIGIDRIYTTILPGDINISLQTIVAFVALLYAVCNVLIDGRIRINLILIVFILLLFCYFVFSSMLSDQLGRSLTYVIMLLVSLIVFVVVSSQLNDKTLRISNQLIYLLGVVIVAALYMRYLHVIAFEAKNILDDRSLWDIGSDGVYEVEYGRYIAFQGYTGDPNLVGSATAIVFFCGLAIRFGRYDLVRHLLNVFLIFVIFSSFSRGAISALIITCFATAVMTGDRQYRYYILIIGAVICAALLWLKLGDYVSLNPLSKFSQDFSRRIADWSALMESIKGNPFLGCGLRCDESMLGKYAENSYIAILVNTGLIGVALYYGFIMFVYFRFISRIKHITRHHPNTLPWFSYVTYLILVMWFVSMDVKIHFWTSLAVLAAFSIYKQRSRAQKIVLNAG